MLTSLAGSGQYWPMRQGNASGAALSTREVRDLERYVCRSGSRREACRSLAIGRGTLDRALTGLGLSRRVRDHLLSCLGNREQVAT